jgi:hypothetical protein
MEMSSGKLKLYVSCLNVQRWPSKRLIPATPLRSATGIVGRRVSSYLSYLPPGAYLIPDMKSVLKDNLESRVTFWGFP